MVRSCRYLRLREVSLPEDSAQQPFLNSYLRFDSEDLFATRHIRNAPAHVLIGFASKGFVGNKFDTGFAGSAAQTMNDFCEL